MEDSTSSLRGEDFEPFACAAAAAKTGAQAQARIVGGIARRTRKLVYEQVGVVTLGLYHVEEDVCSTVLPRLDSVVFRAMMPALTLHYFGLCADTSTFAEHATRVHSGRSQIRSGDGAEAALGQ